MIIIRLINLPLWHNIMQPIVIRPRHILLLYSANGAFIASTLMHRSRLSDSIDGDLALTLGEAEKNLAFSIPPKF